MDHLFGIDITKHYDMGQIKAVSAEKSFSKLRNHSGKQHSAGLSKDSLQVSECHLSAKREVPFDREESFDEKCEEKESGIQDDYEVTS